MDVDVQRLQTLIESPPTVSPQLVTVTAGEAQALVELLGVLVVTGAGGDDLVQIAQGLALDLARRIPAVEVS